MRRHKVGRIDRIQFARFWKVPFEVCGVNLDVRQISAVSAAVLSMIFVLNCGLQKATRKGAGRRIRNPYDSIVVENGLTV